MKKLMSLIQVHCYFRENLGKDSTSSMFLKETAWCETANVLGTSTLHYLDK